MHLAVETCMTAANDMALKTKRQHSNSFGQWSLLSHGCIMLGQVSQQVQQMDRVLERTVGTELGKQAIHLRLGEPRCHKGLDHEEHISLDLKEGPLLLRDSPQEVKVLILEKVCVFEDAEDAKHLRRRMKGVGVEEEPH